MLKIYVRGRASGKTTEIIIRMRENKDIITLVPTQALKNTYPEDVYGRVFSFYDFRNRLLIGKKFSKIIIDEGFMIDKEEIANLYYRLGRDYPNLDIEVYGTID